MEYRPLHKIRESQEKQIDSKNDLSQDTSEKMKVNGDDATKGSPLSILLTSGKCRLENIHETHSIDKDRNIIENQYNFSDTTALQNGQNEKIKYTQNADSNPVVSQFYAPIPRYNTKSHFEPNFLPRDASPVSGTFSATSSEAEHSDSASIDSTGERLKPQVKFDRRDEEREKSIIKSAHISNEYVRLRELLDAMSPEQFLEEIRTKLDKKDSKAIVALSVLLPRKHFPPIDHYHCVRCHKKFRSSDNGNCILKHPTTKVVKIGQDKNGADFKCIACTTTFRLNQMYFYNEDVNSYLSGLCFRGKHTVNPKEVSYSGAIRTCEENGCVEFYV